MPNLRCRMCLYSYVIFERILHRKLSSSDNLYLELPRLRCKGKKNNKED